ncbi:hypothetical protein C5B96_16640 [Subtercola sp. Z020]|uniref:hypothetical protein n=1 Tax=Subtercola sp. Z020 TaxID=2080582 RepID=UPI000CE92173|nr:hypothetical protein [Subtercola sp. Z020]PPF75498.1 hypothetical protein C5B96_16640 [Subtercola sp. Z020]
MNSIRGEHLRRTCLLGGCGIVLGSLYSVALALAELIPEARGLVPLGDSVVLAASAAVIAVAFTVLAVGVHSASIVGGARWGRLALIVFGTCPFLVQLSSLLVVGDPTLGGAAGGWVAFAVGAIGLTAGMFAAIAVARGRALHGYARWALLPAVTVQICNQIVLTVPGENVAALSFPLTAVGLALTTAAGVSYALKGPAAGIRRLAHRVGRACERGVRRRS